MEVAGAPADLVVVRGHVWRIVDRTRHADCESVRLRGAQPHNAAEVRTLLTPFDRLIPVRQPAAWRVLRPRRWLHAVRRLALQCHAFGTLHSAAGSRIDLLPYQLEPALAIVRGLAARVLIADEVGLGKTIQAGLVVAELAARHDALRALILVPAALKDQWQEELRARFDLDTIAADTRWLASMGRTIPADVNPWGLPGVYVSSVDFVKRAEVLRPLEDITWDLVVVDEAHAAAPTTDRGAAVHAIASRSRRVLLLTATPHGGDAEQFEALCGIGSDGRKPGSEPIVMFRRARADASPHNWRRTVLLAVRPSRAERRMQRVLERYSTAIHTESRGGAVDPRGVLAAIVLRKRALSSAASLLVSAVRRQELLAGAAPVDLQLLLPLGDEDPLEDAAPADALAAPGLADGDRERRLLTEVVHAARRAAVRETKVAALLRLLRRTREPIIVFTEFRDTLTRLAQALLHAGHAAAMLHGGMTTDERTEAQRQFNESGTLLLATDAASEGLNLHHRCRVVVHFELPWRPLRLQQRAGRVDRIGQQRRVHEIFLIASDTAERLVLAPLVRRLAGARQATAGAARLFESLGESRVAAAVLTGAAIEPDDVVEPPASCTCEVDIREGGRRETERLIERRSWLSMSGDCLDSWRTDRIVTALPSRSPKCALLYRLTLRDAGGQVVHAELLPVAVQPADPIGAASAGDARSAALELLDRADPIVRQQLRDHLENIKDSVATTHARATAAMRERERAIASNLPSVARQLVQAGLFDRRALRSAEARRHVHDDLVEEAANRINALDGSASLTETFEAVAVLLQ